MILSIFNDFCTWWVFWWIAPFLLGFLLGRVIWGRYKRRSEDLESEIIRQRTAQGELQKRLKASKNKHANDSRLIKESDKELERLQNELAAAQERAASWKLKSSIRDFKNSQKNPVIPVVPYSESTLDDGDAGKGKGTGKSKEGKGKYPNLKPSNLQIIEGIGSKMEAVLNENGITTWAELCGKSLGELRAILDKYGSRYSVVDPSQWAAQARLAKKQKWDALIALQSEDGSDSKFRKIVKKLGLD